MTKPSFKPNGGARDVFVTTRMRDDEVVMLRLLAEQEERSASDTMRRLVVKAFKASGLTLPKTTFQKRS